ncbi:MAG: hypothetical protein K940chlam5_00516 [Candidatus Anoxychlamydiales bacterium]|nr:hypothetical protein [Candidatus Anoxychlamydiales bacterium]
MPVQPTAIDTASLKKAYGELNTKVNDLNKQVRNHNIKTILKVYLCVASSMALGVGLIMLSVSLAGIATPLTTFSLKAVSILSLDMLILYAVGSLIQRKLSDGARKTQNEFLSKINIDFKRACDKNSNEINNSIFFCGRFDWIQYKESKSFKVQKIELAPFEEVKEMYIEIQKVKRQEEQNSGFSSFLSSFLRREEASA